MSRGRDDSDRNDDRKGDLEINNNQTNTSGPDSRPDDDNPSADDVSGIDDSRRGSSGADSGDADIDGKDVSTSNLGDASDEARGRGRGRGRGRHGRGDDSRSDGDRDPLIEGGHQRGYRFELDDSGGLINLERVKGGRSRPERSDEGEAWVFNPATDSSPAELVRTETGATGTEVSTYRDPDNNGIFTRVSEQFTPFSSSPPTGI